MPKRSWVWQYYSEPQDSYVTCNMCTKKLKFDKCTTNLIKHMKVHDVSKKVETSDISLGNYCTYKEDNLRMIKIDSLIVDLVTTDLQPLSIVENSGFTALLKFLDSKYCLPNRKLLKEWINYEETQILVNVSNHKLILEVETWWISTYNMFQRLLQQKRPIVLALASLKFNFKLLSNSNALAIILLVLRIFFLITKEVSSKKDLNLSKIIPMKKQLYTLLYNSNSDLGLESILPQKLICYVEWNLRDIENNQFYVIATLLDPRFKTLAFLNSQCISRTRKVFLDMAANYIFNDTTLINTTDVTQHAMKKCETDENNSFRSSFDDDVTVLNGSTYNSATVTTEIENYLLTEYVNRKADSLSVWFENLTKYAILSKIVSDYLCIVATSVPPERVFSKAGNLMDKKKNRLKEKIVNQILFLNSYINNNRNNNGNV